MCPVKTGMLNWWSDSWDNLKKPSLQRIRLNMVRDFPSMKPAYVYIQYIHIQIHIIYIQDNIALFWRNVSTLLHYPLHHPKVYFTSRSRSWKRGMYSSVDCWCDPTGQLQTFQRAKVSWASASMQTNHPPGLLRGTLQGHIAIAWVAL